METVFRLIVGLGNPGDRYRGTRHNVGFSVVDELARRAAVTFSFDKKWDADVAQCGGRMLMKPQTFMNLSGESVGNYARFFKIEPREVLVILDDVSLPAGALRIRPGGRGPAPAAGARADADARRRRKRIAERRSCSRGAPRAGSSRCWRRVIWIAI